MQPLLHSLDALAQKKQKRKQIAKARAAVVAASYGCCSLPGSLISEHTLDFPKLQLKFRLFVVQLHSFTVKPGCAYVAADAPQRPLAVPLAVPCGGPGGVRFGGS